MAGPFKYTAFISYSTKDVAFARRLHAALERYHIPASLGEFDLLGVGVHINRVFPVYFDREELAAGILAKNIRDALNASNALIVVCSLASAKSHWVEQEIRHFVAQGRAERVFAVIAEDAPFEIDGQDATKSLFPIALREAPFDDEDNQPVAADARPGRDNLAALRIKIVAGLIGVAPGKLNDRDRRRRRRNLGLTALGCLAVSLCIGWLVVLADVAAREGHLSAAQLYAERAAEAHGTHQNVGALYYATASLRESRLAGADEPVDPQLFASIQPIAALASRQQLGFTPRLSAVAADEATMLFIVGEAQLRVLTIDASMVASCELPPDSRVTAIVGSTGGEWIIGTRDGRLLTWSGERTCQLRAIRARGQSVAALAALDHNRLAVGLEREIAVLDAVSGRSQYRIASPDARAIRLAFDRRRNELNALMSDQSLRGWRLAKRPRLVRTHDYAQPPQALAIAKGRAVIFISDWNRTIHRVPMDRVRPAAPIPMETAAAGVLDVSPDESLMASGGREGDIHLWDVDTGRLVETLTKQRSEVLLVHFLADRHHVLVVDRSGSFTIWSVAERLPVRTIAAHDGAVRGLSCLVDRDTIVSVGDDRAIRTWRVSTGLQLDERQGGIGQITTSALTPDGRRLILGGVNGDIAVWRVPRLAQIDRFQAHEARVTSLDFGRNGVLASASWDGSIAQWALEKHVLLRRQRVSQKEVSGVAFLSSGGLASAAYDGSIRLWHPTEHTGLLLFGGERYMRRVRAFSGGNYLAAGGASGKIQFWSGENQASHTVLFGPNYEVWSIEFSPDGRYLVVGSRSDGAFSTLRLWDTRSMKMIAVPKAHFEFTLAVCFVDGQRFVTGGNDGLLHVWDIDTLRAAEPHGLEIRFRRSLAMFSTTSTDALERQQREIQAQDGTESEDAQ